MMEALKLLTEMGWPASVAIVGIGAGISLAFVVRGISNNSREQTRLRATRDTDMAQIAANKTNGAIAIPQSKDYD